MNQNDDHREGKMKSIMRSLAMMAFVLAAQFASATAGHAESVLVKYRGEIDLAPFLCEDISRSSFIERVCYDSANSYMLISLKGTYYHYCEIDSATVGGLMAADSMGRFYNQQIKGNFDCRVKRIPRYQ